MMRFELGIVNPSSINDDLHINPTAWTTKTRRTQSKPKAKPSRSSCLRG